MKKGLKKTKKFIAKRKLASISVLVFTLAVIGVGSYTVYSLFQPEPVDTKASAKKDSEAEAGNDKQESLSDTPTVAESTAPITAKPSVPPGMKKIPTAQEEKVMQACMRRDEAAYNKYYTNFNAELNRHQAAIAAINAQYDGGSQYKGVFYFDGQAKALYDADIAQENSQSEQTKAAINSTYNTEKSPAAC